MKRCPECRRDYYDDTLTYCLDDGNALLEGPASEPATLILAPEHIIGKGETGATVPPSSLDVATPAKLRRLAAAILILAVITALGAFAFYKSYWGAGRQSTIKSLAVLPLENLSGDPTQEYFADGMTENLIGNLSQIRSLTVISRRSVMRFKGNTESVPEIARQLGVDAVIEGTVQQADGRIKITTQLVPATTNAPIWSRSYEGDLTNVLKLQSDVAQAIASEVHARLTPLEQNRLNSAKTIDPKAHEAYLLGSYHLGKLNERDLALAVDYFEQATRAQPDFADAYAGLSRAWTERGIWGGKRPLEVEPSARAAAEKALQLDPDNSRAHTAIAAILLNREYNWVNAEAEAKRAIELDPGNAEAYVTYSWILQCLGRHNEVIPNMEMAKKLDPVSTQIESDFGRMLYRARKYGEAEGHLKRSIELDSNNYPAYGRLADAYLEQGRFDEAIALDKKVREFRTDIAYDLRLATVYARMGRRQEALQIIGQLKEVNSMEAARAFTALGQTDKAFKILNDAFDSRDTLLSNAKEEPGLDPLHSDPRWKDFLRRMNFPDA